MIATEKLTNVNKAAVAIFAGTVGWVLYICWGSDFVMREHQGDYVDFLNGAVATSSAVKHYIAQNIFLKCVAKAAEVVLFLISTMTIVQILHSNGCFDFLTPWIRTRKSKKLLWMLTGITFLISANLDMNNYLFYEPKGSLKLIIKGGELYDIKMLDVLTNYDIDIGDIKKKDEKAYSEINLSILRYINKARINLKQYINDFILDNKFSENDELNIENKKLSQFEIEHKLYKVAEAHCKDLCNNGTSGHVGSDNSTLENRIEKFKIKSKKYDECIIFGYNNPISIVNSLIINKYSKKKKERKIFLNNNYKKIGISLGEHICYGYCCVIVFSE